MAVLMGPDLTAFAAQNFAAISASLVTIPGGTFMMGSKVGEGDELPVHEVTLSTFQMGKDDVTNEQYGPFVDSLGNRRIALIGANPATGVERVLALGSSEREVKSAVYQLPMSQLIPGAEDVLTSGGMRAFADSLTVMEILDHKPRSGFDRPRQPAQHVSWYESFIYAFLHGCMLPTEAQYEFAARVVQGSNELREYATRSGTFTEEEVHSESKTTADVDHPRYSLLENGLRQLVGNVWRWMQNWYGSYPKTPVTDPIGPISGTYKSTRGGSYNCFGPQVFRAAVRGNDNPRYGLYDVGFRLAAKPQGSEN
jgi:sulfatase modifying factor 1